MSVLETVLIVGLAIIAVPPILERLKVDIRAGEVITGVLFILVFPGLGNADWLAGAAEFGLLVLMFEIGLDIDVERLKETLAPSLKYALVSFILPFAVVFAAVTAVTADLFLALIIATGLSSTALAVVSPLMRRRGMDSAVIKNAVMFTEMIGITMLVMFAQGGGLSPGRLLVQAAIILGFVTFTILLVPRLTEKLHLLDSNEAIRFETKAVLFIVLALAAISDNLGIHAATGAFLAGMFFSESTHKGLELEEQIKPIVNVLVPIFFFHIGTRIDPTVITPVMAGAAMGLAALVYIVRVTAFRVLARPLNMDFDFTAVNLFAPCITITATAAEIAHNLDAITPGMFATLIIAGLILTVIGPAISSLNYSPGKTVEQSPWSVPE